MASRSTRRRGSRQFWPRVKASKNTAKIGNWNLSSGNSAKEINLLGFVGYKVGMTNITVIDNFSHTLTKGTTINVPTTIIECPPITILSYRLFGFDEYGNLQVKKEISVNIKDKNLSKKIDMPIKNKYKDEKVEDVIKFSEENDIEEIRAKIMTSPKDTGIGQKKAQIMEIGISDNSKAGIEFIHKLLGNQVKVSDVFKAGELVDSHGITIGRGFQGAVKRFGVKLTSHKSEKTRRHAGNVGAWTPSRVLTTQPLAGQLGYFTRCEWNKWILKISDKFDEINNKAGFTKYGVVKNEYILIKGSIQGPSKRLITFVKAQRPNKKYPKIAPEITYIKQ